LLYLLVIIISIVISLYSMFRSTGFQTFAVQLTANYLSHELKSDIRIRGFDLSFKKGLVIQDISVLDLHKEVIFSARELGLQPGRISFSKHILNVKRVFIDKGTIQLLTHQGDSTLNLQFIIDYFTSKDTVPEKADTTPSPKWDLSVSRVILKETRFHLQDKNNPVADAGMDYTNIDVSDIDLDISGITFEGDTINATIRRLSAKERSGFVLHSLSGEFRVSPAFLKAHNLKILTDNSDLDLTFDFLYDGWRSYNDFLNKVTIQAKIQPSYLDLQDIGYFAPELLVMKDRLRISGDIKGTVANFKARNFRFAFGKNTYFYGNISALGLPNVEETFIDMNIKAMNSTKEDIESLLIPGDMHQILLPGVLSNIGVVGIKGFFTGFYNDFVANARFTTNLGNIVTDLTLKKVKGSPVIGYKGQLDMGNFSIGRLIGSSEYIGNVSLRADINGSGFSEENARVFVNMHVDSVFFNRYNYTNLDITGSLAEKKYSGKLVVNDPNIRLDFNGLVDFGDSLPNFDFTAWVHRMQLFKLNLLDWDSVMDVSTQLKVDFTGNSLDNIDGSININNTLYTQGAQEITMDHFSLLTSQDTAQGKSYHLNSDFVDADVSGHFSFRELIPSLATFIQNYLASFRMNDSLLSLQTVTNQVMKYEVRFKNTDEVTAVFLPFVKIAPTSYLKGDYNEERGSLTMKGASPLLDIYGLDFENWYVDAENKKDNLFIRTGCDQFFMKRKKAQDSVEVRLDTLTLVANIRHDTLHYKISFTDLINRSEFDGYASFRNTPAINLKLKNFNVYLNKKLWTIDPGNLVVIDTSSILLKNLAFLSDDQFLRIQGAISKSPFDTLDVGFNKVDISEADKFIGNDQINVDGILSGIVHLSNFYGDITLLSDLRIDKFKFNRELLGDATFKVKYDALASRFDVNSQIIYTGNVGTNIPFSLTGSLFMDKANPRLDFDLALKNLNLKMLNPFVKSFMTRLSGFVSGDVKITGKPEKPVMLGQLNLMRTEFAITYLNVPYSIADVVRIDTNAFVFNNIPIYDSLGHKAYLNGQISHHHFKDMRLGLKINLTDFAAFNNSRAQNPVFYGKARGSGTVDITGPPDNISIQVRAKSGGNTHVVIPIDVTQSIGQNDFIIFEAPESDSLGHFKVIKKTSSTGLSLDLALQVNQDAVVDVFFPDQLGNIKASGNGNLLIGLTPTTPFTLSGSYVISKGSFLFQLKNLLRLPMSIKEGSRITWTGDVTDASISLSATYKTKTSLKGLTSYQEEQGIRIPVECVIRLSGKLMNPDMSFGLNLPNVEQSIKDLVYSTIDTNNASVMTEQVIYLMVMNQFKPIVAASGPMVDVGSASMSLVTNQINSWLSGLSQNVNLSMNYRPASGSTSQEFDVGVSTQFFNDRLLIDGTFGMNSYSNATIKQGSTIVGDINIQYALTKNRRWWGHLFNRTNNLNILNNNSPYTQGIGITFKREFTNFKDLFTPAKKQKKVKTDNENKK